MAFQHKKRRTYSVIMAMLIAASMIFSSVPSPARHRGWCKLMHAGRHLQQVIQDGRLLRQVVDQEGNSCEADPETSQISSVGTASGAALIQRSIVPGIHPSATRAVDVVISRYHEDVSWVTEYTNRANFIVYNKGANALPPNLRGLEVRIPNLGREAGSYLHHIVHNYDNLADWTVFYQGSKPDFPLTKNKDGTGHMLTDFTFDDYLQPRRESFFLPTLAIKRDISMQSSRKGFLELVSEGRKDVCPNRWGWNPWEKTTFLATELKDTAKEQGAPDGDWVIEQYAKRWLPSTTVPDIVHYAWGAQFATTATAIRRHPKAFYDRLLAATQGHRNSYHAYMLETLWWYIFEPEVGQQKCQESGTPDQPTAMQMLEAAKIKPASNIPSSYSYGMEMLETAKFKPASNIPSSYSYGMQMLEAAKFKPASNIPSSYSYGINKFDGRKKRPIGEDKNDKKAKP
jgi:hypothetical protein